MYKKEVVEQHEKGFQKAIKQAKFFAKDLELGLFYPFKDMNDGFFLDEEEIVVEEEAADEGRGAEERGDDAQVQATFCLFSSFLHGWILAAQAL